MMFSHVRKICVYVERVAAGYLGAYSSCFNIHPQAHLPEIHTENDQSSISNLIGEFDRFKRYLIICFIVYDNIQRSIQSKGCQRIGCQADKMNLHSHNLFPDKFGNNQNIQHTYHMKSSTSHPCRNRKLCVHIT